MAQDNNEPVCKTVHMRNIESKVEKFDNDNVVSDFKLSESTSLRSDMRATIALFCECFESQMVDINENVE